MPAYEHDRGGAGQESPALGKLSFGIDCDLFYVWARLVICVLDV